MSTNEIISWLKQSREAGFSDAQIAERLKNQGWNDQQINQLLQPTAVQTSPSTGVHPTGAPQEYTPKNYTVGSKNFRRSWALIRGHWKILFGMTVILFGFSFVVSVIVRNEHLHPILFVVLALANLFVASLVWVVLITMIGRDTWSLREAVRTGASLYIRFAYTTLLASIVIFGGYLLFAVPGILMGLAFTTLPYVIVNEKLHGFRALARSYALARNFRGNIFGSVLSLSLFVFLVTGAAFVGVIILLVAVNALLRVLNVEGGNAVSSIIYLAPLIVALLPIFSYAYYKNIYLDLAKIRPVGTDPEVEARGKKLFIAYVAVAIILGFFFVSSWFGALKNLSNVNG